MAQQVPQEVGGDPATQAFITDRQIFWNRFTRFTVWSIVTIVALLIGLWLFVA